MIDQEVIVGFAGVASVTILLWLSFIGKPFWGVVLGGLLLLGVCFPFVGADTNLAINPSYLVVVSLFVSWVVLFGVIPLRRILISSWVIKIVGKILPRMGDTERIALEAGTVWWDGALFSGKPPWRSLLDQKIKPLSEEEKAFLAGPCEQLCAMVNEWDIQQRGDLSPEVWNFIKSKGFFGIHIPKALGGLEFSAAAHSAIVTKIASRSVTTAVTVMVPNSLGPAELLMHYGTEEQKQHYLPRLARGEEVPCFALTGPEAGSDAAAMQSIGVVCKGQYEGKEVLGMRLNWRKRYITLGPVSTVIGLAFRLKDPEGLLGNQVDLGITCALVPSHISGIEIGKRHDPMGVPFQNGPNTGTDVFIPVDFIIGGKKMAGQGWKMLMESLAAGRSISLPALSVGAIELSTRVVGAYATVREQFDTPIGRFEGIEEPLARIGATAYWANAMRVLTASAVDAGEKPAVISAIAKCYLTEAMRAVVIDAMDIRAGAGICRGPRNILAHAYVASPIGITVEGANILTRSMIIYGQGAIRCHPFVRDEMSGVAERNLAKFDRAFFGHIGFVVTNKIRALLLALSGSRLASVGVSGPLAPWLRQVSRMSAAFALISDVAMGTLGGSLKRREKISGRLADALAWMYMASSVAKRFFDEGERKQDLPFMQWCMQHALYQIQQALVGVLDNLPMRIVAIGVRFVVFPLGLRYKRPNDALGSKVARALLEDKEEREALTQDIYIPPAQEVGLGRLEAALDKATAALGVEAKIRDAVRSGKLDKAPGDALVHAALSAGIITQQDVETLHDADEARSEVIRVDAFEMNEYHQHAEQSPRVPTSIPPSYGALTES